MEGCKFTLYSDKGKTEHATLAEAQKAGREVGGPFIIIPSDRTQPYVAYEPGGGYSLVPSTVGAA